MITYEFPLNERVRTLLRLESLYERAHYFAARVGPTEHHVALISIFEILEVASRADLKSELMQELERQKQHLETLKSNPSVEQGALSGVLSEIEKAIADLYAASGKTGQELRENDWLMSIKQRTGIPGGVCEFDLPSYHFWLNQNAEARQADLASWLEPFAPIRRGVTIVLKLLREGGKTSAQTAAHGAYQQMLAGRLAQMIRIKVDKTYGVVPEVSANKYALNVRFTSAAGSTRRQSDADVSFDLTFCSL